MSLVNRVIRKYAEIFCWKMWVAFAVQKLLTFCQQKTMRISCTESAKTVNEMTLNELVKLTTLWTTGPWWVNKEYTSVRAQLKTNISRHTKIGTMVFRCMDLQLHMNRTLLGLKTGVFCLRRHQGIYYMFAHSKGLYTGLPEHLLVVYVKRAIF